MKMLIRTVGLYFNFMRYRIKYHKQICFRGFCVLFAMRDSEIVFNIGGGLGYFPIRSVICLDCRKDVLLLPKMAVESSSTMVFA